MLLEKLSYSENDIVTIKLVSGEEVIGKFLKEDEKTITLDKPLMLAMSQKGVGMAPVLMTVNPDSKLNFSKLAIVIMTHSDEEIGKQYTYQTTGIQPVSSSDFMR